MFGSSICELSSESSTSKKDEDVPDSEMDNSFVETLVCIHCASSTILLSFDDFTLPAISKL